MAAGLFSGVWVPVPDRIFAVPPVIRAHSRSASGTGSLQAVVPALHTCVWPTPLSLRRFISGRGVGARCAAEYDRGVAAPESRGGFQRRVRPYFAVRGAHVGRVGYPALRVALHPEAGALAQLPYRDDALDHARSPQRMSEIGLQRVAGYAAQSRQVQRLALHLVVVGGRRAVGVYQPDLPGSGSRLGECRADSVPEPVACARRRRYVVGVVRNSASRHAHARAREPSVACQQDGAARFAQRQPVACRIVGTAKRRAHRLEGVESADDEVAQQVESCHEDMVVPAAADQPCRDDDGRNPRDAGVRDQQRPVRGAEITPHDLRGSVQVASLRGAPQRPDLPFGRRQDDQRPLVGGCDPRAGDHPAQRRQHEPFQGRISRESLLRRQRPEPLPVDQAYGCGVVPRRQRAFHGTYGGHVLLRAEAQRRYHVVGAPPDRYFTSHRSFHLR